MTSNQLLELLKREIVAAQHTDEEGRTPSLLGALDLIELFKKHIQNESIQEFISTYRSMVPNQKAKVAALGVCRKRAAKHSSRKSNSK